MKRFCFDTSGFSNPQHTVPIDRFPSLWDLIGNMVVEGEIAMTADNYDGELVGTIRNSFGAIIDRHRDSLVLEIGDNSWDYPKYLVELRRIETTHHDFIAGRGARQTGDTVNLNDIAAVALAKATGLPLVSMETSATTSLTKKRIPDICALETVDHLTFIEFLRREDIKI